MLSENIKIIRKSRGLSQQELAAQLNVVRQTISKWEQGLSVPDADLLIALSGALDTPVSTLLGEAVAAQPRRPPSALPKNRSASMHSSHSEKPRNEQHSSGCSSPQP